MIILRSYTAICAILIVLSIGALFVVKYEVQKLAAYLQNIESNIQQKQESIHILRAELAYLSKPKTINALVDKYLNLKLMTKSEIVSLN